MVKRFLSGRSTAFPDYFILLFIFLLDCVSAITKDSLPNALQDTIWRQLNVLIPQKIVEPFAVSEKDVERARSVAYSSFSQRASALALKDVIFAEDGFGLTYAPLVTATASETLKRRAGNCLSLASVYIGLARGIGLRAHYLDASGYVHEVFRGEQAIIRSGHVTAVVETESGKVALDLGRRLQMFQIFRLMSDQEATAHFYNNRGYELLNESPKRGLALDWQKAADNFAVATRVMPTLINAWNNLGVALVHLKRTKLAELCYRRALQLNPHSPSPHLNLGLLYFSQKNLALALRHLQQAAQLDPKSTHLQFNLGLVYYRDKNIDAAKHALRKALDLDKSNQHARTLLEEILGQSGEHTN